jgi:hypothetical protein
MPLLEGVPGTARSGWKAPLRVFIPTTKDFHHLLEKSPHVEHNVLRAIAKPVADLATG